MIDITNKFDLINVDHDEIREVLASQFNTSGHDPNDWGDSLNHTIWYGNKDLIITFKSKTQKIRLIQIKENQLDKVDEMLRIQERLLDNSKCEQVLYNDVLFVHHNFSKFFKYKEVFQLVSIKRDSFEQIDLSKQYPILLRYHGFKTGSSWVDSIRRRKQYKTIASVLSCLAYSNWGAEIITYDFTPHKAWVIPNLNEIKAPVVKMKSCWRQLGFVFNEKSDEIEEIEGWPELDAYFFNGIRNQFDMYFSLKKSYQEQIQVACNWFLKALCSTSQTDSFLFNVIAIESLMPNEKKCKCGNTVDLKDSQCENCGRCVSGLKQTFVDFVTKHSGVSNPKIAKELYDHRSQIVHSATNIGYENDNNNKGFTPIKTMQNHMTEQTYRITSNTITNYLMTVGNNT